MQHMRAVPKRLRNYIQRLIRFDLQIHIKKFGQHPAIMSPHPRLSKCHFGNAQGRI
jgi:hypothetical protein